MHVIHSLCAVMALLGGVVALNAYGEDGGPPASWWQGEGSDASITFRAANLPCPLYGGIPIYDEMFKGNERNDHTMDNPFHDKEAWTRQLEELEALRYNAIVWFHPHPFTLFVDYGQKYPEAAWITADELAAKRDMLRWLIATGKDHGIDFYFLTWNIWVPRGFAEAHSIEQSGVDSPLTRAYTRWTLAEFFRTYPGFGGIIPIGGETPPGCYEFVRDAVVAGMNDAAAKPWLMFFTWCSYPEETKSVLDAYDGPAMAFHYLEYEQFFYPLADPRVGQYSRALGGAEMAALGNAANNYLFFGNPEFIHGVVQDFYANHNGRGMLVQSVHSPDRWLARLAFARYMVYPTEPYDGGKWEEAVAERYGSKAVAKPLVELMKTSSLAMPVQMKLTHSQSDHFCPQGGMMLVQFLEMPTLSSYIFENAQRVNAEGYLAENLGLCWPNPNWGERVLELGQWVRSRIPDPARREEALKAWIALRRENGFNPQPITGDETSPPDVVDALVQVRDQSRATLDAVKREIETVTRHRSELDEIMGLIAVNIAFADYYMQKDRAAIAFESYRVLRDPVYAEEAIAALEKSLESWKVYADTADRHFNRANLHFWQSQISASPPFSQNDLWNSYVHAKTHLGALTPLWERELALVKQRIPVPDGQDPASVEAPLMDELHAPAEAKRIVARVDFEQPLPKWLNLSDDAGIVRVTEDPERVVEGKRSLFADTRASDQEWILVFDADSSKLPLEGNADYQLRVRYRVIDEGEYSMPFALFLRTEKGGILSDVGDSRTWGRRAGTISERIIRAKTLSFNDYRLVFSIHGKAAIVLDELAIEEL
jgi:hypothetical protein